MYSHGPTSAFESETFGQDLSFHIEQPVGSMSISPCGRDVVLASKEGLHIIDLDSPYSPPRYLPHRTSWEVADVQWSPFAARDSWIISTSNQKALVWNVGMRSWQDAVEFVLHGHTRAITDINFSAYHPDVLATCAVDSFVHCWDLRVPARPVTSFSDWFAGATQVKWSRQVAHVVASSHDKYLRIWDDRMGAHPVRSIEAHDTKIYGIDWNRNEQNRIVTCSLDRSIKFWDCDNPEDVPERIINTNFPAWRARHTPFAWGLLAMPQRGNGDLHLYDCRPTDGQLMSGAVPAVARFEGHKGQAKEFLWRPRGTMIDGIDHREFQLVTWGTDQVLRLHRVVPETLSATGYVKGITQSSRLNFTRKGARYRTFRDEPSDEPFTEVFDSQAGSSPAAGQSFHSRTRASTSVGMSKVAIPHSQGWLHGSNVTSRVDMHGRTGARRTMNPIDWMKNVKVTSWNPETLGEEISQVGEKFSKVAFESVDVPQRKAVISMNAPWGQANAQIFIKVDIKFPVAYPRDAAAFFNVQKTAAMNDELASMLSTELRTIAETYLARKRGCLEAVLRYLLREQDMEQIVSWILDDSMENSKIIDDLGLAEEVSSDEDDVGASNFQGPSGMTNSTELLNANVMVPVRKACGAVWADNGKLVCFFPPKPKQPTSFLELLGARNHDSDGSDKIFEGFGRLQADSPGARTALRTVMSGEDQTSDFSDDSSFSSSSSSSSSGSSDNLVSLPTHFYSRNAWRAGGRALHRSKSADHSTQSAVALMKAKLGAELSETVISIHNLADLIPSKRGLAMDYIIFGKGPEMCGYNADVARSHGYNEIADIWRLIKLILWDEVPLEVVSGMHESSDILAIARSAYDIMKGNDSGVDLSYDKTIKKSRINIPGRVRWGESALGGKYLVPALINYFEKLGDVQMLAMLSCVFAEPRASNDLTVLSQQHQQHHHSSMQLKAPAFAADYYPSIEVARSMTHKAPITSFAPATATIQFPERNYVASVDNVGYSSPPTPYSTGTTPPYVLQHFSHQPSDRRRSSRLSTTDIPDQNHRNPALITRSAVVSMSTSPEGTRAMYRFNPHHVPPTSRVSMSALTPALAQSPPNPKRSSPVGSSIGQHMNASGWNAASIFGGSGTGRGRLENVGQTTRSRRGSTHLAPFPSALGHSQSMSSDGDAVDRLRGSSNLSSVRPSGSIRNPPRSTPRTGTRRKVRIKSALHNQNIFDEDGYASVPLLDPNLEWKYKAYRASYARLLSVWGLHTQRAEVLKFDGLIGYFSPASKPPTTDQSVEDDDLALGNLHRRKTLNITRNKFAQKRGLEIRRRCNQCGEMLEAIEKNGIPIGWHCAACALKGTRSSTRTPCVICTKSMTGLMVPCLDCGHVICFECHRIWLARDCHNNNHTVDEGVDIVDFSAETQLAATEKEKGKPCPTGCGCICSLHQFVSVPYPVPSIANNEEDDDGQQSHRRSSQSTAAETSTLTLTSEASTDQLISPSSNSHALDTAMAAILSLSRARTRSGSDRTKGTAKSVTAADTPCLASSSSFAGRDDASVSDSASAADVDANAWARYTNMGKGLGVGVSRTATTTSASAFGVRDRGLISQREREGASEAESRLRRAGGV